MANTDPKPTDTGLAERIEAVIDHHLDVLPHSLKTVTQAILSEIEASQSSKALPEDVVEVLSGLAGEPFTDGSKMTTDEAKEMRRRFANYQLSAAAILARHAPETSSNKENDDE